MNRSKFIFNAIMFETRAYMSMRAKKVPNHYDTLKVHPHITQEDIKSAYYDLSKQYHPDINTSADAKVKFQDISVAYEVLGNFDKRKVYDREFAARMPGSHTKGGAQTTVEDDFDPMSTQWKPPTADHFRSSKQYSFNFEAWTQAHYGKTFDRVLRDKGNREVRKEREAQYRREVEINKANYNFIVITTFGLTIFVLLNFLMSPDHDKPLKRKEK